MRDSSSSPPPTGPAPVFSRKVRLGLRLKLSIGLLLIIGIIFAAMNTWNVLKASNTRRAEALANTETIARLVAGALVGELGTSDIHSERVRTVVNNFLNAALVLNKKNRDFAYAIVVDDKNNVIAGRAKPELTVFPGGRTYNDEGKVMDEIARLEGKLGGFMSAKRFPLQLRGEIVGKLIVGTSLRRLEREMQRDLTINIAVLLAALALLSIYAGLMLRRLVVRRIERVVAAMHRVEEGDLDQSLELKTGDEIGLLADSFNVMVHGLRERERLKDAFSRYVSDKVYQHFQSGEVALSGESRQATILFSDIRSFTTLSEQMTPEEVVTMLNEYFTEMVEIIFKYDGFVNKFIGDAIMAIYNVPIAQDRPELRAVYTALEMANALDKLNQKREAEGKFPIRTGIGINTGPVVAGNIGHIRRLEYTVIGDAVNLASRIESQTKVAGARILISEYTYPAVKDHIQAEALPPIKVKGKAEPVTLYKVTGLARRPTGSLPPLEAPDSTVPPTA